jgi:ABC-type transport system involved in multi-copper enzyme maturation permease subunit
MIEAALPLLKIALERTIGPRVRRFLSPRGSPALRAIAGFVRAIPRLATSPIVRLELAAALRRKRYVAVFTSALLVEVAILVGTMVANVGDPPSQLGQEIFAAFGIAVGLVAILFPAFSCMSIVEERTQKSLDLLLTTCLAPGEIFAGKMLGSFVYCFTFLVATLPVVAFSFLFGGVEPSAIVAAYGFQVANALLLCIIGTYASASAHGAVRAIITAYFLSVFVEFVVGWASLVPFAYWVGPSMGLFTRGDRRSLEQLVTQFGDCFYAGPAIGYVLIGSFFAIAGTNRLKPAAYDRATAMRGFTVVFFTVGMGFFAYCMRRYLGSIATAGNYPNYLADMLFGISISALIIATIPLALAILVFPTEPAAISRRVANELAQRFVLSPLRLLAPGPARGMWFCFLLLLLVLGGLAAHGLAGLGLVDYASASDSLRRGTRGDLAIAELALVIASFLAFLAAFGRFLAERARGTAGPRLWVAGLAIALTLVPVIVWTAEDDGSYSERNQADARRRDFPPPALTHAYFLSPYLAGVSAVEVSVVRDDYPRQFLFPDALRKVHPDAMQPLLVGPRFSATPYARIEAAAVPLHRATIATYLGLALIFAALGLLRRLRRERAQRAALLAVVPGSAARSPEAPPPQAPPAPGPGPQPPASALAAASDVSEGGDRGA